MRVNPFKVVTGLLAAGAGAGLMYLLDPQGGRRRRALLKDKTRHGANVAGDKVSATASDLGNRARGLTVETMGRLRGEEPLPDDKLAKRVRSELGHHTDAASQIEVTAKDGRVTLSGSVLTDEADRVVKAVEKIRGVSSVENRLQSHDVLTPTPKQPSELRH